MSDVRWVVRGGLFPRERSAEAAAIDTARSIVGIRRPIRIERQRYYEDIDGFDTDGWMTEAVAYVTDTTSPIEWREP